jgi:hypothetical protein
MKFQYNGKLFGGYRLIVPGPPEPTHWLLWLERSGWTLMDDKRIRVDDPELLAAALAALNEKQKSRLLAHLIGNAR